MFQNHHITFATFCSKWSFWLYGGSGPRILDDWHRKTTLEGKYIWYNYPLFIWVIFQDQKKLMIFAGKWQIRMMYRVFTVVARAGRLSFKNMSTGLSVPLYICSLNPRPTILISWVVVCLLNWFFFFVPYFVVIRCFTISGFACCAPH